MSTPASNPQLLALSEFDPRLNPGSSVPILKEGPLAAKNPLHQVKTQLTVCLGSIELTVGELLSAKEHQVFMLDHQINQPVDVLLEGQVVARGVLVAVDDSFGVKITELPVPLKP